MPTMLEAITAKLTEDDRAAISRLVKRDGKVRRTPPDWRKDPKAWAAWQGLRTAMGWHGECATFTLMMVADDAREVWNRVSDAAFEVRKALRAA